MIQFKNQILKNILLMIGFGILSVILGTIRFDIPNLDGGGSDMREIGILLSAVFLPNWIYMLGVSFIASLYFPMNNLEVSTILMHCTSSLFAWFFYHYIKAKVQNIYFLGGLWAIMVIIYYTLFLIPTLIIVFYFFKLIDVSVIGDMYKDVLYQYRFELFASTSITTLFIVLYKTTRILKVRNHELELTLIKSEESDRLKTAFINNISHEIRTPLNGIVGIANLITESELSDDLRMTYSRMIQSSSDQLLSTMSNIIEISKIKAGQIDVDMERFSIKELLESIYLQYLPLSQEKKLLFEIETPENDTTDIIFSDSRIVKQIIENLLNNAFKFTIEGSVSIYYTSKDKYVSFYVKDTGSGISKRLHDKIFDHFSKFQKEEEKLHEGIGLGLTIAKALVERLNGDIHVTSDVGKGSVFSFSISTQMNSQSLK